MIRKSFFMTLCAVQALGWTAVGAGPVLSDRAGWSPAGRVFVVEDSRAVQAFRPQPAVVKQMVERGLAALTGQTDPAAAWNELISSEDIVGIKVVSAPGPISGTRPEVVAAVIETLIQAGHPRDRIVIWDKRMDHLRRAGFHDLAERYRVQISGSVEGGFDPETYYQKALLGKLVWGDLEFDRRQEGAGRKSFVTKLLTERLTKVIQITPLSNHNVAGVWGNLYTLALGSVDNTLRFETNAQSLGQAIPEIYAMPEVGDRVVLNIVDGLICQYLGETGSLLHYSSVLNQLRFSTDPVALDLLSIEELQRQRQTANVVSPGFNGEIYANAALLELGVADFRRIRSIRVRSE